jgi:di/tricarboxylate transporter
LGVASAEEAFYSQERGVDWDVIFLLPGMMIIGVVRRSGVFEYVAIWAAKRAKDSPFRVMVLLVLIMAVASARTARFRSPGEARIGLRAWTRWKCLAVTRRRGIASSKPAI